MCIRDRYEGIKYNLIDAPGLFDFEAGEYEGIRAAESVLVCVSGRSGVTAVSYTHLPIVINSPWMPGSGLLDGMFVVLTGTFT